MSAALVAVLAVIVAAMVFDYTNGFHDAANAIATSVSTRALTPRVALLMAAAGNFIGTHFGKNVAHTVTDLIAPPTKIQGLAILFAAVLGAVCWNLITWWLGLPSSSSHALFGGLVGAALVGGQAVHWHTVVEKVVIPMVLSPIAGLVLGFLAMLALMWIFHKKQPSKLNRGFRRAQTVSAALMAVGHGLQDAAKTIGIVIMALYVGGYQDSLTHIPQWAYWTSAAVLALGTYAGGWRIIRTLGRKIIDLGPPEGFAAETVAAILLFVFGIGLGAPISTTHTITSAIMGVGATKKVSAVRWGVAGNIVGAWILTFPGAGLIAVLVYFLTKNLF